MMAQTERTEFSEFSERPEFSERYIRSTPLVDYETRLDIALSYAAERRAMWYDDSRNYVLPTSIAGFYNR